VKAHFGILPIVKERWSVAGGPAEKVGSRFVQEHSTVDQTPTSGPLLSELIVLEAQGLSFHSLPDIGRLSIGRAEDCDVKLTDPLASRHHATLHLSPLGVEDNASANGTFLDATRIEPGAITPLIFGQSLCIGGTLLVVRRRADRVPRPVVAHRSESGTMRKAVRQRASIIVDPQMVELYAVVERLARGSINVLVLGETGVGKELVAETLHHSSVRAAAPLLRVNCAALAEPLLESELFGHERGAFTGAVASRPGLIELADSGTLFLDEVGELSPALQAKLLRVLEVGEITRVGGIRPRRVDVRFVAATNRDLSAAVTAGTFRSDLLFRLGGASIVVPPLRERVGEILPLAERFLADTARGLGDDTPPCLSAEARAVLSAYDFPGNVRELRNAIERGVLLCAGAVLTPADLSLGKHSWSTRSAAPDLGANQTVRESPQTKPPWSEKERIIQALLKHGGNQTRAAKELGLPRRTLVRRIAELGLPRPRDTDD